MEQFTGLVEIQDAARNSTVRLDGDSGDVTVGANGQDGNLAVGNAAGKPRRSTPSATRCSRARVEVAILFGAEPPLCTWREKSRGLDIPRPAVRGASSPTHSPAIC